MPARRGSIAVLAPVPLAQRAPELIGASPRADCGGREGGDGGSGTPSDGGGLASAADAPCSPLRRDFGVNRTVGPVSYTAWLDIVPSSTSSRWLEPSKS